MGTERMSVLVDEEGRVAKIYESVKPADHTQEVMGDIK
jgi:peroxiredoxin